MSKQARKPLICLITLALLLCCVVISNGNNIKAEVIECVATNVALPRSENADLQAATITVSFYKDRYNKLFTITKNEPFTLDSVDFSSVDISQDDLPEGELIGWYYDFLYIVECSEDTTIKQSCSLYGKWETNVYKITFRDSMDKSFLFKIFISNSEDTIVTLGDLYTNENYKEPQKENFTFDGWYFNGKKLPDEFPFSYSMTLYANWTDKKDTKINYYLDGKLLENVEPNEYDPQQDTYLYIPEAPIGYHFSGWHEKGSTEIVEFIPKGSSEEKTFEGEMIANKYNIYLDSNGGQALNPDYQTVTYAQTYKLPVPKRTGYDFIGWYTSGEIKYTDSYGNSLNIYRNADNLMLYAHWKAIEYNIYLDSNGGEALSPNYQTVTYDQTYKLPVPKRTGYDFIGWYSSDEIKYTDSNGNSLNVYKNAYNLTLYAHWKQYIFYADYSGYGNYKQVIGARSINEDPSRMLEFPSGLPKELYFDGWYLDEYFETALPSSFDELDKLTNSTGISVYAKIAITLREQLYEVPNECTRLSLDSTNQNLRLNVSDEGALKTLVLNNFYSHQDEHNAFILKLYNVNMTTTVYFLGNNILEAGPGGTAIEVYGNLTLKSINGANIRICGGDGNDQNGESGGSAIVATQDLTIERLSGTYKPSNLGDGNISIIGGNGSDCTNSMGNAGDGGYGIRFLGYYYVNDGTGLQMVHVKSTLNIIVYSSSVYIKGGDGGDIIYNSGTTGIEYDATALSYRNGGNGGDGISITGLEGEIRMRGDGSVDAIGGNGGDGSQEIEPYKSQGGAGIDAVGKNIYVSQISFFAWGGNSGFTKSTRAGGVGLYCDTLSILNDARVSLVGGNGSSFTYTAACGTGATAAIIKNLVKQTKFEPYFKGGDGGKNTNGGTGGAGYKFTSEEKFSGVLYVNGENG